MEKVNRDSFYKLASDLPEERVQSAVALIKDLSALKPSEVEKEFEYVLNRLISGLSSNRNSARLGFSLCLTEVVNLALDRKDQPLTCLRSIDDFLDMVDKTLVLDSVATGKKLKKGKDERGIMFGRMFALQALLNEPLFAKVFIDKNGKISKFAIRFQTQLVELAVLKNWLREPCLFTLYQTVEKFMPYIDSSYIESLVQLLDKYKLTLTNEGLAIYLSLIHTNGKKIASSLPLESQGWKLNDPLAKGNLPTLTQVLLNSNINQSETPQGNAANWSPRLHFVWDILLPILLGQDSTTNDEHVSKKQKSKTTSSTSIKFQSFWKMVVDESFFNEKSSSERKYLGFLIIQKSLELVPAQLVESLFGQNVLRSMINQSADTKRMLHKISQKVLNSIIEACEKDTTKITPIVKVILFGENGATNFDKLTKTKTINKILSIKNLEEETLSQIFIMLSNEIKGSSESIQKDQFVLDTILHVVRNHKLEMNIGTIIIQLLTPVIDLAFFLKENERISNIAKERFFSLLSELAAITTSTRSWQYTALELISNKEASGSPLNQEMDQDLIAIKEKGIECLKEVTKKSDTVQLRGLECLLSMSLLQLYAGDVDSVSIVEDLCTFYDEREDDSVSLVGITEILLALLAQRKAVLKKIALVAWEQFVPFIGPEEVKVLVDVLNARENKEGFAQLFEGEGEYEVDEEEGDEQENDDEEKDKDKDAEDDEMEDDESSSESDDDSDESDEDIEKINKETTSALAKALNLPDNIINENGEVDLDALEGMSEEENDDDDDDESEEEDDESMDDEKMMELDDQLSEIFKRRKEALSSVASGNQRKLDVKESRENVIAFKHRIIDLLETYIKYVEKITSRKLEDQPINKEQLLNCVFMMMNAMVECIQHTLDRPLADKISKLLKVKLFKINLTFFDNGNVSNQESVLTQLKAIHELLITSKPGQHASLYFSVCSTSSLFLSKLLIETTNADERSYAFSQLIDIYGELSKKWLLKGRFGPIVFMDFYNWLNSKKNSATTD
ncbi:hypothetical protein Kpol_1045p80 [Vanderwaltozyma polyspora DSM 70294]|uniref:DNA polymerase V n=1 Tax=Vanderwaltozyma polyspora (strain ATCC 22028 / DSM 70294 / BCRC 21397 / CBS 2163 / NBRC 10782 / NRRL Y-8283 / UCD 57-17) TaxID=436907 RepID=A7TI86_VANPO|nr:uncharacterized protein Kpol_1045p80 [Vanderwaltozyma polyspora DSM 70294]EDO18093.1 hypothetical protein Kpol_1045p80 [Vanderwaltozyma polyspora DSM 70294]